MPTVTGLYKLDLARLPSRDENMGVRFERRRVNGKNRLLVLYPDSQPGSDPTGARFAGLIEVRELQPEDPTIRIARGLGQIVVTGHRLLGMITDGAFGETTLDESVASIYAFALDRDDLRPVEIKKNWLGKPAEAVFLSKVGQSPIVGVKITTVNVELTDEGQATRASLPAFLERLTADGREGQ